jgi:hypothetical protein
VCLFESDCNSLRLQVKSCFVSKHAVSSEVQVWDGFPFFDILVSELEYSIIIPCSWQLWSLVSVTYRLLHSVSVQSRYGDRQSWNRFAYVVSDIWKYSCWVLNSHINKSSQKLRVDIFNLALSPVTNLSNADRPVTGTEISMIRYRNMGPGRPGDIT